MVNNDDKRRGLSKWEKLAIGIIIILALIIVLLVFNEDIKGYVDTFFNWYKNG